MKKITYLIVFFSVLPLSAMHYDRRRELLFKYDDKSMKEEVITISEQNFDALEEPLYRENDYRTLSTQEPFESVEVPGMVCLCTCLTVGFLSLVLLGVVVG